MNSPSFDPGQYKAVQQKQWDSVADGWRKWWPLIERRGQIVCDRFLELANIGEGQTVLDVATGIGEPALTVAKAVGPNGRVVATDQSDGTLQIARERATEAGLSNIEFLNVDAGGLDLEAAAYDAVTCRWGLMFMPDIQAAMQKIYGALKPGGTFVTSVWGPPEKTPFLSLAMGIVHKQLNLPPPPPEAPSMFKLGAPGALEEIFAGAGFGDVTRDAIEIDFGYESVEEYISFLKDIAAPIRMMLTDQSAEDVADVWDAIAVAAQAYVVDDGRLHLPGETIIVSGRHREQ